MRTILVCALFFLFAIKGYTQATIKEFKKIENGLYVMYYDTTEAKHIVTKSLVVEFKNYLALLEMPISNGGAGETKLTDHTEGGEDVLQALKTQFPGKSLKYVLSTHWHPHSISSVLPFIKRNITFITTDSNLNTLRQFIDSATYDKYKKNIVVVDDKGLTIGDKSNAIEIYKLNKDDYPHMPTEEFLFFYLPKYKCLHNSCMFQRFAGYKVMDKEMISTRAEDLNKFITSHKLEPKYLVTTDTYWDEPGGYVLGDTLRKMMQTGVGMTELANMLLDIDTNIIAAKTDSIMQMLVDNKIPYSILNMAVYEALKRKELKKALGIARLQVLINPSSANSWDTYGEVYYFMGMQKLAKKYETESRKIDKEFNRGGEETWKRDLVLYRKKWGNAQ